jgi:hypothetical protein
MAGSYPLPALTARFAACVSRAASYCLFVALAGGVLAQPFPYPKVLDARQFPVIAWGPSPSDLGQLESMKLAGFNVSGFCSVEDLDKVRAAGLTCFVSDPLANGYYWTDVPPLEEIRKKAAQLGKRIAGNPAALGLFLADEPDASMFPALAAVANILKAQMPTLWPYVNGFPSNAGRSRIGKLKYDDYLRQQVLQVGQPFISYDHYALSEGKVGDSFYANLEIARRVSLEMKVPFWNCILASALPNSMDPSPATLGVQAYSTLAYGGKGLQYFEYVNPDGADLSATAIDGFGNRSPTWDMLRRLNGEIMTLAPTLLQLHSTGIYFYPTPFEPDQMESQIVESVRLKSSARTSGARFLIGEFVDSQQRQFLLLVNADLGASVLANITLIDGDRKLMKLSPNSGRWLPFDSTGGEWLAPGAGMLVSVN